MPRYPRVLVDDGVEGDVRLRLRVGTDGKVLSAVVVEGVHPLLDRLSQRAALLHRYRPAQADGRPAVSTAFLTITWAIDD